MAPLPPHPDQAPAALQSLPDEPRAWDGSASRGARLGAAFIDSFINGLLVLPVRIYTGQLEDLSQFTNAPSSETLLWMALGCVAWLAVNGVPLTRSAQTIGKKLVGIQMVNVSDGKPASFSKLVLWRYLPTVLLSQLPYLGAVLSLVDVLFIFRQDRRCVHDHIAGTRVVAVSS
jgi:uncharacterized RDD family membrane protein YckC